MSKTDKKKAKLRTLIDSEESAFKLLLQRKTNGANEINLSKHQEKIDKLVKQWQAL